MGKKDLIPAVDVPSCTLFTTREIDAILYESDVTATQRGVRYSYTSETASSDKLKLETCCEKVPETTQQELPSQQLEKIPETTQQEIPSQQLEPSEAGIEQTSKEYNWRPFVMHKPYMIVIVLLSLGLATAQEATCHPLSQSSPGSLLRP
jgi:hypothetical protein